jgi:hypothetical protein
VKQRLASITLGAVKGDIPEAPVKQRLASITLGAVKGDIPKAATLTLLQLIPQNSNPKKAPSSPMSSPTNICQATKYKNECAGAVSC